MASTDAPLRAKLLISVTVGLAPGMSIPERCKRWIYTSEDAENDVALPDVPASREISRYATMVDEAMKYAREQMDPAYNNHVQVDWVWL